jgi:multidrug resistance efflux pump
MSEPNLEDLTDYNTLKGQKKRVVWAVILAGLIIGVVYVVSYNYFSNVTDSIYVEKSINTIPVK